MKTESEKLFEKLCEDRGIQCSPIETTAGSKRPDYRIWLGEIETIIEIKQLEPGDFEEKLLESAEDDFPAIISNAASRIRLKFDKAKSQIRNLTKDTHPSLFIVFDATRGLSDLDAEDFLNAMYGDEIARLSVLPDTSNSEIQVDHRFGGQRKVDKHHNRFVSGFGWMRLLANEELKLIVFHNDYADIPIDYDLVAIIADAQFKRTTGPRNKYRGWFRLNV